MPTPRDFINSLQIASPCTADWAEMDGDDRARFCRQCEKHVYDFSEMTAAEGLALVLEKEGRICARLWRRADGTVLTADCPVGASRALRRRKKRLPLLAASAIAASLLNAGCSMKHPETSPMAAQSEQSPAKDRISKKKQECTQVVVGGAAPAIDTTSATTGATFTMDAVSRLPLF